RIRETSARGVTRGFPLEVPRMTTAHRNQLARHLIAAGIAALVATTYVQTPVQTAEGGPTSCESLSGLKLPNTTITSAQTVAPGAFPPPAPARAAGGRAAGARAAEPAAGEPAEGRGAGRGRAGGAAAQVYASLPSFCRVSVTLTPSSDSDI